MQALQLVSPADLSVILNLHGSNAVRKTLARNGVEPAEIQGKVRLYDPAEIAEQIPAWAGVLRRKVGDIERIPIRKTRSDKGKPRKVSDLALTEATAIAKSLYLSSGMPDLRNACEKACTRLVMKAQAHEVDITLKDAQKVTPNYLYRALRRRDAYGHGAYFAEGWKELWRQTMKQHDAALTAPYNRYNLWRMFENAGWAGEGYGFGFMVVIDDRSADVFVQDEDGENTLPKALYVWDALTGCLLWVEPAREVTTQSYVRAIAATMIMHGLQRPPLIVLENSKAAKGKRIKEMVQAIYTEDHLNQILADPNIARLTAGQRGPIIRSVAHIARSIGKAMAERGFGIIKREHDAGWSPETFQGGNRQEAVQMHRSNQPWFFSRSLNAPRHEVERTLPTVQSYFLSVYHWSQTEFLDRERDTLKDWSRSKGLPATRRSIATYYGGGQEVEAADWIKREQLCRMVFAATPHELRRTVKVRHPGYVTCTMDGRSLTIPSVKITPGMVERKIGVVPAPGRDGEFILVLMRWEDSDMAERFLDVAREVTATTLEEVEINRAHTRDIREQMIQATVEEVDDARSGNDRAALNEAATRQMIEQPPAPEWLDAIEEMTPPEDTADADDEEASEEITDPDVLRILNL